MSGMHDFFIRTDEILELEWLKILGFMVILVVGGGALFGIAAFMTQCFSEISVTETFWLGAKVGFILWLLLPLWVFLSIVLNILGCGADQDN